MSETEYREETNNARVEDELKSFKDLTEKQALVRVLNDYKEAKASKADALKRAIRYEAIHEALDNPDDRIDESSGLIEEDESRYANTYMPIGAAIVDSGVAQLFNLIFSTQDYVKIEADDIEDMLFETEVTEFLKKRHRESKFRHTTYSALLQACCFDYSVIGTKWKMEGGYQPKPTKTVETVDLAGYKVRKQTVKAEPVWIPNKVDRSDTFVFDYMRCYHDPTSRNGFEDSRYFIDERDEMVEDLREQSDQKVPFGRYKNIDQVLKAAAKAMQKDTQYTAITDAEVKQDTFNSRRLRVIRYWTKYRVVEVCMDIVIRDIKIYGWPLHLMVITPKARPTFQGMGLLQRLERNQYDINASVNARRNIQNLISDPIAIIDQELLGIDEDVPELYSGRLFVSKGGKVQDKLYIHQPGVHASQTELTDIEMQMSIMQKLSHTDENAFGTVHTDRTTAQEIRQAAAGRLTTLGVVAMRIEEMALEPTYLDHFFLEMTFLSKTELVRYFGEQGERIMAVDASSFMWNSTPRFSAMGTSSVLEDSVKMQQFFTAVQLAAGMPQVEHNWNNIALQMWRYLHPKEYYKFVKDPNIPDENIPPDVENQLMATGRAVRRSPANKDAQHIQVHEALKLTPDFIVWPEGRKMLLERHLAEHKQALQQAAGAPSLSKMMAPKSQDPSDSARGVRGPLMQGAA